MLSFLFSFLMAVLILVTSLYAFGQINQAARDLGSQAQLREVADRVSLGVQEMLAVAEARVESADVAESRQLRYQHVIDVPPLVQGYAYTVSLDKNFINGTVPQRAVSVSVPTFNAAVSLPPNVPPVTQCLATYVACTLRGTNGGDKTQIIMTYVFDATVVGQPLSVIEIS